LRTIIEASRQNDAANGVSPEVDEAYNILYAESGLATGDVDSAPGTDHDWDPKGTVKEALKETGDGAPQPGLLGIGDKIREAILSPVRQISFWKMKDRARRFGESGANTLLRELQSIAKPETHFHLMGHSFGCVVVSATVAGPPDKAPITSPVHSLFLVQGALSLWSYCPSIELAGNKPGYFNRIISNGLVAGPIVTTRSKHDAAVSKLYPKAAGVAGQVLLGDDLPKYGGIGAYGIQGLGQSAEDMPMESAGFEYGFKPARVYNIESSDVIKEGGGFSGAHSDIAHPEVAHVMWQAVLAPPQ
jgi:hypothetical protein